MKRKIQIIALFLLVFSLVLSPCYYAYASPAETQTEEDNVPKDELPGEEELETIPPEEDETGEEEAETDDIVPDTKEEVPAEASAIPETEAEISLYSNTYQGKAVDDSGNFANLVVFVDFADTDHNEHSGSLWGECFQKNPNLTGLFQGDAAHPRAMKQYLKNISYGAFEPANIFPQYDPAANKIYPYKLKYNTDYYADDEANGDTHIIQEVLEILASSNQLPSNINLDRNNDGCVDNLMIIVPCEKGYKNEKFYGHKAVYAGNERVNSKQVANYTLLPEGSVYTGMSQSGVVIHEFLHTLGCPDLYIVKGGANGCVPVGYWDIMATTSMYPQYPLAYFRAEYLNWFSIPTVTSSKEGYSIYSASDATEKTKNNQAVILKTDYSSSEFFVLEFRKQGVQDSADPTKQDYDCKIPGSGLVIYRVNMGVKDGNSYAPPYMVYVFGENDTYDEKGFEKADYGRMQTSFLSAESKRTSFGNSDLNASLSDNALTYSDGTNSGIVISNVGSAKGDQITFDITFTQEDEESRWKVETEDTLGLSMSVLDSCRDEKGDMYCLVQTDYASGASALLKYSNGKWIRTADGPKGRGHRIVLHNGKLYTAYLDTSFHVRLAGWNGKSWDNLLISTVTANEVRAAGSTDGVYLAYANQNGDAVYAYKYSGVSGIKQLGDKAASSSGYAANVEISSENGNVFVVYREAANNNYLYVKQYGEKTNSWSSILNGTMQGNTVSIKQRGDLLYLLKNGTTFGKNGSYLYVYDIKAPGTGWTKVGSNMVTDTSVNEADICFNGSVPYIAYNNGAGKTCVMECKNGQWNQLGTNVSNQDLSGLKLYYDAGKLYTAYLDSVTGRITVRYFAVDEQKDVEIDSVVLNKESCTLGVGESETLSAVIKPADASGVKTLTWSSSDDSVAVVDSKGRVTGKKAGSAVITVKTSNGKTSSCTVNVTDSSWRQNALGYWYQNPDGSYPYNQWKKIDGYWYHFNPLGYRETGWILLGGIWYYLESDGKMVTGTKTIGTNEFYFGEGGAMLTGWQKRDGSWYYYAPGGAMVKGAWQQIGGIWYYLESDGKMATGTKTIGTNEFYFNGSGVMLTGWQKRDGSWYYYAPGGAMIKGAWQQIGGIWYYLESDGKMATGTKTIGTNEFYFNGSGVMLTGWQKRDGSWYYYAPGGAMVKGAWQQIGGIWYYLESDGRMATGTKTIGTNEFYFNGSGVMLTGWQKRDGSWYYYAPGGAMVKGAWQCIGGLWYYLKEDGKMAANEWIGKHYVNSSGIMI